MPPTFAKASAGKQFSNILLIDTSKPTVWVALVREGAVAAEKEWAGDKTLGTKLLEAVEELVTTPSGSPLSRGRTKPLIDRVGVHRGPGHFMATRTGVVTAQLLAQAWRVELVGIEGDDRDELIQQAHKASPVDTVRVHYE